MMLIKFILIFNFIINLSSNIIVASNYSNVWKTGSIFNFSEINNKPKVLRKETIFPTFFRYQYNTKNILDNGRVLNENASLQQNDTLENQTAEHINYTNPVLGPLNFQTVSTLIKQDNAMDRYTPGEAVAIMKIKNRNQTRIKIPSISALHSDQNYLPSNIIYNFPPDIESFYAQNIKQPKKHITSYIPPPAGPVETAIINDVENLEPLNPNYLPNKLIDHVINNKTELFDHFSSSQNSESGVIDNNSENITYMNFVEKPEYYDSSNFQYENLEEEKDLEFISPWKNLHSSHTDVIFGNNQHNFQNLDHHRYYPKTTTSSPLEPVPSLIEKENHTESRVKKYSYFYLGRKLWYIPLYFTVWFSFYILWLIVKSIARHKVNLPNHYTSKTLRKRQILSLEEKKKQYADVVAYFVLKSIERFHEKNLSKL